MAWPFTDGLGGGEGVCSPEGGLEVPDDLNGLKSPPKIVLLASSEGGLLASRPAASASGMIRAASIDTTFPAFPGSEANLPLGCTAVATLVSAAAAEVGTGGKVGAGTAGLDSGGPEMVSAAAGAGEDVGGRVSLLAILRSTGLALDAPSIGSLLVLEAVAAASSRNALLGFPLRGEDLAVVCSPYGAAAERYPSWKSIELLLSFWGGEGASAIGVWIAGVLDSKGVAGVAVMATVAGVVDIIGVAGG